MSVTTNSLISGVNPPTANDTIYANDGSFGGFWNGVGDDTAAVNAACAAAGAFNPPKAVVLPPRVVLSGPVYVPTRVYVFGYNYRPGNVGTYLTCTSGYTSPTGFCFNFNTTDGVNPASNVYARPKISVLAGIHVANPNNTNNFRLMCGFGSTMVMDIYAVNITQIIAKPLAQYTDNWEIRRIHWLERDNAEYMIDLQGTGEALIVSDINCPVPSVGPQKFLRVRQCRGGTVARVVNGIIRAEDCSAFDVSEYHGEVGYIETVRSNVRVRDSWFSVKTGFTHYPIDATGNPSGTIGSYTVTLTNVDFIYGNVTTMGGPGAEVILRGKQISLQTNSVRRTAMTVGEDSAQTGIRVHDGTGTAIAAWNNNSWYLSANGLMSDSIPLGQITTPVGTGYNGLYGQFAVSGYPSTLTAATYRYISQRLIDSTNLLGRNSVYSEISQAVTAGQCLAFIVDYGPNSGNCIVRVYRGTSAGVYDKYVDIPAQNCRTLVDDGATLSGFPWLSRSAGGVDTLNVAFGEYLVTPSKGAQGLIPFETIIGDADSAIGGGGYINSIYVWNSPLTAARTATLSSLATRVGTRVRVVRTAAATGAFNLNINNPAASLLKALSSAGTWAEVEYCSDSTWRVTASGSL